MVDTSSCNNWSPKDTHTHTHTHTRHWHGRHMQPGTSLTGRGRLRGLAVAVREEWNNCGFSGIQLRVFVCGRACACVRACVCSGQKKNRGVGGGERQREREPRITPPDWNCVAEKLTRWRRRLPFRSDCLAKTDQLRRHSDSCFGFASRGSHYCGFSDPSRPGSANAILLSCFLFVFYYLFICCCCSLLLFLLLLLFFFFSPW